MKYFLMVILIFIFSWFIYSIYKFFNLLHVSRNLVENSSAYSKTPQMINKKVLFIGDSLGIGVGASTPSNSIAGRFAQDNPQAKIINLSLSGAKIHDGLIIARGLKDIEIYDLIIIQLGANDITRLTSEEEINKDLRELLTIAKLHSKKIVFLTSGNVGHAPIFPFPINYFYTIRSNRLISLFQKISEENKIPYINLNYNKSEDIFLKNINLYYASDQFHVGDAGYAFWYQKIIEAVNLLSEIR